MPYRTVTARRLAAITVIAALTPLFGVDAAGADPTPVCSTTDPAFCASYSIGINAAGTDAQTVAAATPADFSFDLANTSAGHATETSDWLDHAVLSLADGLGPVFTP